MAFRLIAQFADTTIAEVTFNNGHRVFTAITSSANVVAYWINKVVALYSPSPNSSVPQVVGLHVERSKPSGPFFLLQLFIGNRCLLYQMLHREDDPPRILYGFLNDARFCFTGVGAEVVVNALRTDFGFRVRLALDLGHTASRMLGRVRLRRARLEQLAREVMQFVINRPDELWQFMWRERVLPPQMVVFACTNSFVSYELGRIMLSHRRLPFLHYGSSSIQ